MRRKTPLTKKRYYVYSSYTERKKTPTVNMGYKRSKGGKQMNPEVKKALIIAGIILYIVSPIDLCPGPLDDLIVTLLGIAASKRVTAGAGK